ncbi:hypothetical protein [Actinokineospora sp.]|uniref:hypothetical protein n=1 Tax=Actinokineospora sp. TaxID=1872133 RepID=UPI0040381078
MRNGGGGDDGRCGVDRAGLAAQIGQFHQGAQGFLKAANSGEFGVNDRAGKAILTALHTILDGLEDARDRATRIKQDTKLGTSPDAKVIIAFNKDVAAGDNSAATSLQGLRDALIQIEAGINEAMRHYRNTDDNNAGGITRASQ